MPLPHPSAGSAAAPRCSRSRRPVRWWAAEQRHEMLPHRLSRDCYVNSAAALLGVDRVGRPRWIGERERLPRTAADGPAGDARLEPPNGQLNPQEKFANFGTGTLASLTHGVRRTFTEPPAVLDGEAAQVIEPKTHCDLGHALVLACPLQHLADLVEPCLTQIACRRRSVMILE